MDTDQRNLVPVTPRRWSAPAVALLAAALVVPTHVVLPAAAAPSASSSTAASHPTVAASSTDGTTSAVGDPLLSVTRVTHSEDGTSTDVVTRSQGDVYGNGVENRSLRHSTLQPTGRWVRSGDEVRVTVPAEGDGIGLALGAYGSYATLNGGRNVGIAFRSLTAGTTTTVVAPHDGMVYLEDHREGAHVTAVTVSGGHPAPTFVRGRSTTDEFRAQVERWPDAPMSTLVGQRVLAEFQTNIMRDEYARLDVEARIAYFDRVVELSNHGHGLVDGVAGLASKLRHRIHFTNPDTGTGWGSASPLRLAFQNASGAGRHILTAREDDQWGLWHEVGHSYQTPTYNWSGMVETAVNVGPLHIQDAQGYRIRLDDKGYQDLYDRFFGQPVDQRDIDAGGDMRLLMIDQLRRAFGDSALPRVNQHLRMRLDAGEALHASSDSRKQAFATSSAQALGRDLRPFFEQFGFRLDDESRAVMAALPPLEQPIWENRLSTAPVVEEILPSYSVPTATVSGTRPVLQLGGADVDVASVVTDVRDSDPAGTARVVDVTVDANSPGTGTGSIRVTLENASGVRDVIRVVADVRVGTGFGFTGTGGAGLGGLALDGATGRVRASSSGVIAHAPTGPERHVGVVVQSADGTVVASGAVRGRETAATFAAALDGTPYAEGTRFVVTQKEASTTTRFADDVEQPAPTALTHAWRVVDDALVADDGTIVVAPAQPTHELSPGRAVPVESQIATVRGVSLLRGDVVFTAPAGSTFAPGQEKLGGQIRHAGGSWFGNRTVELTEGTLSDDGRTLSYRLDTTVAGFGTQDGSLVRWSPLITTPANAAPIEDVVRVSVSGRTNHGAMEAQGTTPTSTTPALRVRVTSSSNVGRSATVSGTAVPGAVLSSGGHSAVVEDDGTVSLLVEGLDVGRNTVDVELRRDRELLADDSFVVVLHGDVVTAEAGDTVGFASGMDTRVPVTLGMLRTHEHLSGEIEMTAPEGTTFAPVAGTIPNEIRQTSAHGWQSSSSTPLRDVVLSDDGRTLRAKFSGGGGSFLLPGGAGIRWSPVVRVPEGHRGDSSLAYSVTGSGTNGDWAVDGATPTSNDTRTDHTVGAPGEAVQLEMGADAPVPHTFRMEEEISSLRGQLTFRAPAGTRFAAGQSEIVGAYRHPGATAFVETSSLRLVSVQTSDDGRQMTGQLRQTGGGFRMHEGSLLRWQPVLEVSPPTAPHRTTATASFVGSSNLTAFSGTLEQPLRLGDAPDSDVEATDATSTVLRRGESTPIPFGVSTTIGLRELSASLVLTAPAGTTFEPGQTVLVTEIRLPGGGWTPGDTVVVGDGDRSADGATLTFAIGMADASELPRGAELRWAPVVSVPADAELGSGSFDWKLVGTTERGHVSIGG